MTRPSPLGLLGVAALWALGPVLRAVDDWLTIEEDEDVDDCTCTPGTHEDGWREKRCEACIEVEMAEWGRVLAWARNGDIVKRIAERKSR